MNKLAVALGLVFIVALAGGGIYLGSRKPAEEQPSTPTGGSINLNEETKTVQPTETIPDATELKATDLQVGTGAEAAEGKQVSVHYTGTLTNGQKFDSSLDRGQPFQFMLGAGRVIKGWDMGVKGMKVGGKRQLIIPPDLGYGASGQGSIPPNATLVFEVELLGVQ